MSILKRTIYYGAVDSTGIKRFLDWAVVDTTLGSMIEPFTVNQKHVPNQNFETCDPTDECNRVDSVENIDLRDYTHILNYGTSTVMHGGDYIPRALGTK